MGLRTTTVTPMQYRFMKMIRKDDGILIRQRKNLNYIALLIASGVAASLCGNDFQSHPLIENCNCVCVNLININFIRWCQNKQKCDRDDKSGRKRRIIWCQRTNKQTSEWASTLFDVLLRFKYVKLRKITLCASFFGIQIYRIFQPVYGNLCSLFLFCVWITNNSFVSSFADLT